jgi:hypothetical protein
MRSFYLYGDKYRSYVIETCVPYSVICSLGMDGCFMERVEAATPEDAMRSWSVSQDNALTPVKPGVWRAQYDLVTLSMREYALLQNRKSKIRPASKVSRPQQQALIEVEE